MYTSEKSILLDSQMFTCDTRAKQNTSHKDPYQ